MIGTILFGFIIFLLKIENFFFASFSEGSFSLSINLCILFRYKILNLNLYLSTNIVLKMKEQNAPHLCQEKYEDKGESSQTKSQ